MRGEAPRAVDDDPHGHADLVVDDGRLQLAVAQLHDFGGDAVNAQVGVACPRLDRRGQCRVGKLMPGQREEIAVNTARRCHPTTVVGWQVTVSGRRRWVTPCWHPASSVWSRSCCCRCWWWCG